jgi:hypothetical protein
VWTIDPLPIWIDRALDRQARLEAPLARELFAFLMAESR